MDNVGIVVESLDAAISFFAELGLELEGRAMIEGDWSGRVTGLRDQRVEIAMMRMPDGHGRIELSRFLTPPPVADHRNAPVNALGYLRVMFAVDDLDHTLAAAPRARRAARRRSGPVQRRVSALLRPRPRGHSHRASRANRLTPKRARASFANTGPPRRPDPRRRDVQQPRDQRSTHPILSDTPPASPAEVPLEVTVRAPPVVSSPERQPAGLPRHRRGRRRRSRHSLRLRPARPRRSGSTLSPAPE